jgi:hypothetical protein
MERRMCFLAAFPQRSFTNDEERCGCLLLPIVYIHGYIFFGWPPNPHRGIRGDHVLLNANL